MMRPDEFRNLPSTLNDHEPEPISNEKPAVWDLVIGDMKERDQTGRERYGTPLQPFNGRNSAVDAYQEILDLVVYMRQMIEEHTLLLKLLAVTRSYLKATEIGEIGYFRNLIETVVLEIGS